MAAQSKTTAVHFSLIIFVMLTVILGVVALLFFNDYRNQEAQFNENKSALTEAESAVRRQGEEIAALKKVLGVENGEVGDDATADETTVIGQAKKAIATFGSNPAAPSMVVALQDLRNELSKQTKEIAARDTALAGLQKKYEELNTIKTSTIATHNEAVQATEADLAAEQAKAAETVAAKDAEVSELRTTNADLQGKYADLSEQSKAKISDLEQTVTNLRNTIRNLQQERDRIRGESFDRADGKIVEIDQVGRTVWIDLGEKDGLKPRITFSIYNRNNAGIGKENPTGGRPEDIKGSIEVTRIMGDKMAEARILGEVGDSPIAQGDLIYTPLWGAGRSEQFAFIGDLDIDGDGNYTGDRERLHDLIKANNAKISSELLTTGERKGGPIDQNTRFLVIGDVPLPTDASPDSEQQAQYEELNQQQAKMRTEAESHGVRIISLNSFLDFIGFVPQRNRFSPGDSQNWTLDAGERRRGESTSSGNTSGLFDKSRRRPNPSGETSQRFGQ